MYRHWFFSHSEAELLFKYDSTSSHDVKGPGGFWAFRNSKSCSFFYSSDKDATSLDVKPSFSRSFIPLVFHVFHILYIQFSAYKICAVAYRGCLSLVSVKHVILFSHQQIPNCFLLFYLIFVSHDIKQAVAKINKCIQFGCPSFFLSNFLNHLHSSLHFCNLVRIVVNVWG